MSRRLSLRPREAALWLLPFLLLTALIYRKESSGHGVSLFVAVALSMAVFAVGYLLWHRPVIYTFLGGLALSIFSGNWKAMGLPGSFVPDRFLLVAAILMLVFRGSDKRYQSRDLRLRPAHVLLALTVLYAVVSAAVAGSLTNRGALFALLDQLGAIPFLMFFVAPLVVRTADDRRLLLTVLVWLGLYLGVEGLFEAIKANALVFPHYIVNPGYETVDGRVRGPFAAPVTEGFALFACATAAAVTVATQPPGKLRSLAKVVTLLCLFVSFFTLERGVWIGIGASVLIVGLVTPGLRVRALAILLVVVVGVGGALVVVPGLSQRTTKRADTVLSVWDRENQDVAAVRMIKANPLFGVGWSNFTNVSLPYFREADYPMSGYDVQLHDVYLSNAVELGLVGCFLWLLAQIVAVGSALGGRPRAELGAWRTGLLAMITFAAIIALFNPLSQNFSGLVLWTWAGVTAAGARSIRHARPRA